VDLLPTITEIVGIDDDGGREGTSLVDLLEGGERPRQRGRFLPSYATLCECTVRRAPGTKCIRTDDWKLIVEPITSLVELYNLIEDPSETLNLWGLDIPEGDSFLRKLQEVPGVRLHGWRLACTGSGSSVKFSADLTLPAGGRFIRLERFTRKQTLVVEPSDDSTAIHVEAEPDGLDLIMFDVDPPDAHVGFAVSVEGDEAPMVASVGASGELAIDERFDLAPDEAVGLPREFGAYRTEARSGLQIWWLSGEAIGKAGRATKLTPEETKRLKALGYLQ
jgi:hypothetical protein